MSEGKPFYAKISIGQEYTYKVFLNKSELRILKDVIGQIVKKRYKKQARKKK